jgi:hypothetical protein
MLAITVLLVTGTLAEATARVFWRVRYGIALSRPDTVLHAPYPELQQLTWKDEDLRWQHPVRILFLGGSVLHPAWGNIEQELRERLTVRLGRPVVVFNMAEIGHTSRDSDVKYRALEGARFDLVEYVSMDAPRPDWLEYGAEIRSAASFEENLRGVVATARGRGEPLLVMTFATYLPDDYSLQAFNERRLDYTLHLTPIEMWGTPQNVLAAVARHNEIVRSVAAGDPGARLFDQASAMPKGARHFNDVCRLTAAGSSVFVQNMLDAAVELLSAPRVPR